MNTIVSFRLNADKKAALDAIAERQDRDRSYVINEAVDYYLKIHEWQIAHIKEAVRQADKGEFASEEEVKEAFAQWRE